MVTPPALRAATEALLQLQQNKNPAPTNSLHRPKMFAEELARQIGQQSSAQQNNAMLTQLGRPIVFLPIASEASAQGAATSTTQRRSKKNKPNTSANGQVRESSRKK